MILSSHVRLHQNDTIKWKNLQEKSGTSSQDEASSGRVAAGGVARDTGGSLGGSRGLAGRGAISRSGRGHGSLHGAAVGASGLGRASGASLGGRGSGRGRRAAVAGAATLNLDALPVTRVVTVAVRLDRGGGRAAAAGVVGDLDALVVSDGGALGEVGNAARPLSGTLGSVRLAANPCANLDLHGGLGELLADIASLESADGGTIDDPLDGVLGPLDRVNVRRRQRVADRVESTAVEGGVVALGEVVGLSLRVVGANPLPVNLVEIVRLENSRGDNTGALGSLDLDIDATEEDVLAGHDGGSLGLLSNGEDGTLALVLDRGALQVVESRALARAPVTVDLVVAKSRVGGAACENVTVSDLPPDGTQGNKQASLLFLRGLQSVEVWAETREVAARATARVERVLENILKSSENNC